MATITPLNDKVFIAPLDAETETPGGIILPDSAQKKPSRGIVRAAGPGRLLNNGSLVPVTVKVGDTVLYGKYGGSDVTIDGEDLKCMDEEQIYAVVTT